MGFFIISQIFNCFFFINKANIIVLLICSLHGDLFLHRLMKTVVVQSYRNKVLKGTVMFI
jgi:hypothetical protein